MKTSTEVYLRHWGDGNELVDLKVALRIMVEEKVFWD